MPDPNEKLSLRGRRWRLPAVEDAQVSRLSGKAANPQLARLMALRGVLPENADGFLDPKLRDLLPDPYVFQDMEKASQRLVEAMASRRRIGIWSDYDIDGATSAAILGRFLRMCGHPDFVVRIPDRIREGYGPNTQGLLEMQADGCDVVFILDAGIVAFEPLAAARAAGLDIVVVDHHAAEPEIPDAVAVVNPNRHDDSSGLGHLCAAGVTFMLVVAATRLLRQSGYFDGRDGRPEGMPAIMTLLDLVALGTVGDVVSLKGLNRAFVVRGLPFLSQRLNPGIAALAELSGIDAGAPITERDCGWKIGPRINAGGRIGASDSGALLLLEDDPVRVREMAQHLEELNRERQEIGMRATQAALAQMAGRSPGERTLALAVVEDAHEGIVGISAGRLREALDAPAIVLSRAHDGNLKGSARSVPGVDIGHAIIAARKAGLLVKGGGHGMAGGLTVSPSKLEAFREFVNAEIAGTEFWKTGLFTEVDLEISLSKVTVDLIRSLDVMRPFGSGNPEPMVMIPSLVLAEIRIMKEKHFKLVLRDGKSQIDALIWNVVGTELGEQIQASRDSVVDVIGHLQVNEFRGSSSPQLMLEDVRTRVNNLF